MPIVKRGAAAFSTRKQYVRQLVDKEKKDRVQVVVKRPGGRNEESLSTAASGLQYSLSSGRDGRSKSANVGTTVSSGSGGTGVFACVVRWQPADVLTLRCVHTRPSSSHYELATCQRRRPIGCPLTLDIHSQRGLRQSSWHCRRW